MLTAQTQATKTILISKFGQYHSDQLDKDVTYEEIKSLLEEAGYAVRLNNGFVFINF